MKPSQQYLDIIGSKSVPEPKRLRDKLFFPINPKYISILLRILVFKYLASPFLFLIAQTNGFFGTMQLLTIYTLSYILDFTLLTLLFISSNENSREKRISAEKRIAGALMLLFGFYLLLNSLFAFNRTIIATDRAEYNLLLICLELLYFYLVKEQLVKSPDRDQDIYELPGPSKFLFAGFVGVFGILLLIPLQPGTEPWEFYVTVFVTLVVYLVFVDLWISGPNAYMDRESIHRLTDLSVFGGVFFVFVGLLFLPDQRYDTSPLIFLYYILPMIFINLFSKYHGYIFRTKRHVQVARMIVDDHLVKHR